MENENMLSESGLTESQNTFAHNKNQEPPRKKNGLVSEKRKKLLFYSLMIAIPSLQYFLFVIYVNINTFILGFQKYSVSLSGGYDIVFAGFENFKEAWQFFASSGNMILNSLYLFIGNMVIVMSLALIFSYYIAKEHFGAKFFRVVLYMPSVISSVVLIILYKYIVTDVFATIGRALVGEERLLAAGLENGLLGGNASDSAKFGAILFYNLWIGFGANVMIFTGSMSSIDQSIIESAQLDGAGIVKEFLAIYIPMIWPTFVTFVVTGMAAIFTNNMGLVAFYGAGESANSPFDVFGYFMYRTTLQGGVVTDGKTMNYSVLSALGLIISVILIPIILTVRKVMEKYGPRTD